MYKHIIKIECITNLHVGSGDTNYNIVDNEIEREAFTKYPIIHSSGVKGAFKDAYSGNEKKMIFGSEGNNTDYETGRYKFMDARIITRPMRLANSTSAYVPVATKTSIEDYLKMLSDFGCNKYGFDTLEVEVSDFDDNEFLARDSGVQIEGEKTGVLPDSVIKQLDQMSDILPAGTCIAKDYNNYPLPVIARNCIDNGKSENLWYEEYVPRTSVFYTMIITEEENLELDLSEVMQFGGHSSIGYGYSQVTEIACFK